jgi:hypothetical protein
MLFVVAGCFTLTAPLTSPVGLALIAGVAAGHFAAAALAFALPWRSWPSRASLLLAAAMLGLLGLTGWVFDGFASGVGPLFVLVFCWLGLHHPRGALATALPLAVAAYAGGLVAADASTRLVWSTAVVMPVAALVGALIEQRVRALRATQDALQRKDRWRGALMATLAHDVRSPLSTSPGCSRSSRTTLPPRSSIGRSWPVPSDSLRASCASPSGCSRSSAPSTGCSAST